MEKLNLKNVCSIDLYKKLFFFFFFNILFGKNSIIFLKFSFINKILLNRFFYIYKGNNFRLLKILKFQLNFRFGAFVFTRKPFKYLKKIKKDLKKKR